MSDTLYSPSNVLIKDIPVGLLGPGTGKAAIFSFYIFSQVGNSGFKCPRDDGQHCFTSVCTIIYDPKCIVISLGIVSKQSD